ncbi:MAG: hypothetical protein HYZ37_12920 [Candidatus Solibacter usitatus]|nr:hypothetical protein [Candidatus Solibacter usitatus]
MRLFFSQRIPDFTRILLVESGARSLLDGLIPGIRAIYGERLEIDLVTCYAGEPAGLPGGAKVYRVWDYPDPVSRARLARELCANQYAITGIICSGEPIMNKWKWWLAWKIPAKVFVLNENGDYYWFDYSNWRTMLHFAVFRMGLTGADAVTTIARVLLCPFTLAYLLLYAAFVHLRRKVRA